MALPPLYGPRRHNPVSTCCDEVLWCPSNSTAAHTVASITRDSYNGHAPVFGIPENILLSSITF